MPSQEIDLGNISKMTLFCVEWDVKPQLSQSVIFVLLFCNKLRPWKISWCLLKTSCCTLSDFYELCRLQCLCCSHNIENVVFAARFKPFQSSVPLAVRMRCCASEKRAVYGSGYTQLFGLPILASVPRHNCCYNTLYNCVLAHLVYVHCRHVSVSDTFRAFCVCFSIHLLVCLFFGLWTW